MNFSDCVPVLEEEMLESDLAVVDKVGVGLAKVAKIYDQTKSDKTFDDLKRESDQI